MAGFASLFSSSKLFARYYQGDLPQKESNEVDVLSGAFMMLNKKAVEATEGFDENFFMYGEDVDLSYRIKKAGMSNYYFAGCSIIHFKGESTQRLSADYIKNFYEAMSLFVKKHYSNKRGTVFFMLRAIWLSKTMAGLKLKMNKQSNIDPKIVANTAVLASQNKFTKAIHLMKYASPPILIAGRIAVEKNDSDLAIGNLDDIKECIRKGKIGTLLFCEGDISFKKIIETADKVSGKINFLFHAHESESIVGSNDKNAKGIFITKQEIASMHPAISE
jgi:hypothetical protein